ncbi:GtrA family protein [Cryobacterium sp. TMT1-19]|uniref:GtrA family protein n=1 Tax=Cryobacterium sp. TMT1-19 TaxID=1259231 RepID=UPI001F54661E|nr:GtrA family protein [Cryobacterium sp. TMT1-19]
MRRMLELATTLANDQRIRFLVIGGVNTVVGYGLFAALDLYVFAGIPFGYLLSLALSYTIAITLAFILYRRFVFHVTGQIWTDLTRFVSVYLVSIGVNAVALPILIELFGLNSLIAQAIVLVCTTLISFFGHRKFSFRRASESQA